MKAHELTYTERRLAIAIGARRARSGNLLIRSKDFYWFTDSTGKQRLVRPKWRIGS